MDLFQYKTVSEESKKKTLTKDCKVIRVSSNGLAEDKFSFSGKPWLNVCLENYMNRKIYFHNYSQQFCKNGVANANEKSRL